MRNNIYGFRMHESQPLFIGRRIPLIRRGIRSVQCAIQNLKNESVLGSTLKLPRFCSLLKLYRIPQRLVRKFYLNEVVYRISIVFHIDLNQVCPIDIVFQISRSIVSLVIIITRICPRVMLST